ncbi:MAG: TIGR04283 family arsenosugar biosynthesis glycosyltransferase [Gemmatimonadetes bacterium]|nr:TIGR04283 family arsenosugar biosynthesis glycosyltransferase [Gemmatimonadota bacterium]
MSLSVVIPTLNEGATLPLLLSDLGTLSTGTSTEIVVADGGSSDDTVRCARAADAIVITTPPGRARQLNAGARATRSAWLLFLHADSRLHEEARRALRAALADSNAMEAAVFRFAVDLPSPWRQLTELGQVLRERLLDLPYGDQGMLIRRELFEAVGGYPDIPIMEDVAMMEALRRRVVIRRLPAALVTSGRRYRRGGVMRTWLSHMGLLAAYFSGVPPAELTRWRARAAG